MSSRDLQGGPPPHPESPEPRMPLRGKSFRSPSPRQKLGMAGGSPSPASPAATATATDDGAGGAGSNSRATGPSDDETALANLEKQVEEQQRQLQAARQRMAAKKRREMQGAAMRLEERLKGLGQSVEDQRQARLDLRDKLRAERESDATVVSQLDDVSAKVWDVERGHRLEELARLQLMAETMRNERQTLERMIGNRTIQLEGIEEERQRRAESTEQILLDRLRGKDTLSTELNSLFDAPQRQAIAAKLLVPDDDAGGAGAGAGDTARTGATDASASKASEFRLSDEIIRARRRKLKDDEARRRQWMKQLGDDRSRLHAEQQQLAERRQQVEAVNAKGLDFLVEVEWGSAPPMDYILKNMEAARRHRREEGGVEIDDEEKAASHAKLTLDLSFDSAVAGKRDSFVAAFEGDIAESLGTPAGSVRVLGLGAGSVVVSFSVASGQALDRLDQVVGGSRTLTFARLAKELGVPVAVKGGLEITARGRRTSDRGGGGSGGDDDGDGNDEYDDRRLLLAGAGPGAIEDMVQEIKGGMGAAEERLSSLRQGLRELDEEKIFAKGPYDGLEPYDGHLGVDSYLLEQRTSYFEVRSLLDAIVDDVLTRLFAGPSLRDWERKEASWQETQNKLVRRQQHTLEMKATRLIAVEMLDEVVAEMVASLAEEVDVVDGKAAAYADNLLLRVVQGLENDAGMEQVAGILAELRKKRERDDDVERERNPSSLPAHGNLSANTAPVEAAPLPPLPTHLFSLRDDDAGGAKSPSRPTAQQLKEKALREAEEKRLAEEKKKAEDPAADHIEDDEDVVLLYAESVRWLQASSKIVRAEREYWTRIKHQPFAMPSMPSSVAGGISFIASSPCGRFTAAGTLKGSLAVFDMRHTPPTLCALVPVPDKANRVPIVDITWSLRSDTLVTVNVFGQARVVALQPQVAPRVMGKRKHASKIMVPAAKYKPPPARVIETVTIDDCRRPDDGLGGEGEGKDGGAAGGDSGGGGGGSSSSSSSSSDGHAMVVHAVLHPSTNLVGQQYALCVGLGVGLVVKHNFPSLARFGALPPVAPSEPINPLKAGSGDNSGAGAGGAGGAGGGGGAGGAGNQKPEQTPRGTHSMVRREFFPGHLRSVLFIGFVGSAASEMVTVDDQGHIYIWPYDKAHFSGYGWFRARAKFRLVFDAPMFTPAGRDYTRVFPASSAVVVPADPEGDAEFMVRSKEAADGLLALGTPYHMQKQEDGTTRMFLMPPEIDIRRRDSQSHSGRRHSEIGTGRRGSAKGTGFDDPDKRFVFTIATFNGRGTLVEVLEGNFQTVHTKGQLVQCMMDQERLELNLFVMYPAVNPKPALVRVYSFDLITAKLVDAYVEVPIQGVSEEYITGLERFDLSPMLPHLGTDYLYAMIDSTVRVYSMLTGAQVTGSMVPRVESNSRRPDNPLLSMSVSDKHNHFAVGGPDTAEILAYAIADANDHDARLETRDHMEQASRPTPMGLQRSGTRRLRLSRANAFQGTLPGE